MVVVVDGAGAGVVAGAGAGAGAGVVVVVAGDGDVTPELQIFPMMGSTVTAWPYLGVDILPARVQLSAAGL